LSVLNDGYSRNTLCSLNLISTFLNRGALNLAVFSELGVIPIAIDAIKLSVGFWNHLANSDDVT